ncbi:MAG TPA: hypothetical protein VGL99_22420 [Chloroflexota bacterium]
MSFERDIRPLFRARDRDEMSWLFDLWQVEAVRTHSDAILSRIEDGSMPCDAPWPEAQMEMFRRWIEAGKPD